MKTSEEIRPMENGGKMNQKEGQRRSQRTRSMETRIEQLQNGEKDEEQADFTR